MARSTRSSSTSRASVPPPAAQVVVMAKYPSPGTVQTRLAARLGATTACRLYAAFVGDLAERLAHAGLPVCWAVWPPDAPFAALVPPAQRCFAQVEGDLGRRMEAAMRACRAVLPLPVIVLGADAPHLDPARLTEAAAALAGGADVVLGPAADGGYYLIAQAEASPALFHDTAWRSSCVLDAPLARAGAAGLRVHLLAPTFDVDDADGLAALRTLLAAGGLELPRTAAVLATIPN